MTSDIIFSFDTTGSMRPCIMQVRRVVAETVKKLFQDIDYLRIGVIAHGDYIDRDRCITELPLTNDQAKICQFVETVPNTSGGDCPECYEYVLHRVQDQAWKGDQRALVLIGDDIPHTYGMRNELGQRVQYNWREEAATLHRNGIKIYPVQALSRSYATEFYSELAAESGTPRITLDQFSDMPHLLMALTYQNAGQLDHFEADIKRGKHTVSKSVLRTLDQLAGRDLSKRSLATGSKYQVLEVDRDISIQGFVELNGLEFEKGRGFYEWMKSEIIQDYKEVIAQNIETGAIITGQRARSVLDIVEKAGRQKPLSETHRGFVQSTSVNRKLIAGTKFLYEIKDSAGL
jgi:von Willebrand factor type A domain-containing protein